MDAFYDFSAYYDANFKTTSAVWEPLRSKFACARSGLDSPLPGPTKPDTNITDGGIIGSNNDVCEYRDAGGVGIATIWFGGLSQWHGNW